MTKDQATDLSPTELLAEASRRIRQSEAQETARLAGEAALAAHHRARAEAAATYRRQRAQGQGLEGMRSRWLTMDPDDMTRLAVLAEVPDKLLQDREESWTWILEHTEALARVVLVLAG